MARRKEKKIIKVPPLSELVARLICINANYKVVYEKEFAEWCNRYVGYLAAVVKGQPGFMDWHNRAAKLAREAVEGPSPVFDAEEERIKRERRIAFNRGREQALHGSPYFSNPYVGHWDKDGCSTSWRDGWVAGMNERGLVTRVN